MHKPTLGPTVQVKQRIQCIDYYYFRQIKWLVYWASRFTESEVHEQGHAHHHVDENAHQTISHQHCFSGWMINFPSISCSYIYIWTWCHCVLVLNPDQCRPCQPSAGTHCFKHAKRHTCNSLCGSAQAHPDQDQVKNCGPPSSAPGNRQWSLDLQS